jgi:hypothetical protein
LRFGDGAIFYWETIGGEVVIVIIAEGFGDVENLGSVVYIETREGVGDDIAFTFIVSELGVKLLK